MSNIENKGIKIKNALHRCIKKPNVISAIAMMLIFSVATIFALIVDVPVKQIMTNYNYDVLVLLIVMELFTNLIMETGIMEFLAVKLAEFSKGKKRACLVSFGGMMFLISALLNNITAVMMILPVVFVLLKAIEIDQKYVNVFFAVILALSNTGGASSPIGDFPAIVIMTSGITSFLGYLANAFPLFAVTSAVLLFFWSVYIRKQREQEGGRKMAVSFLKSQYKFFEVKWRLLAAIAGIFLAMFLAWSFVPQELISPEIIAVLGYVCAASACAFGEVKIKRQIDMKSVLLIASFLYLATAIGQSGILATIARLLQSSVENPILLLLLLMVITSVCSGLFSAGPAAAAMMPIIVELNSTTFAGMGDLLAIAYAASICAGSSLFMSSATAGFILSEKVNHSGLCDSEGHQLMWGIGDYFKYGIINYLMQLSVAIIWILLMIAIRF